MISKFISGGMPAGNIKNKEGTAMGKVYGYVRVSTREQNEGRKLAAMREARVPQENIFIDKQSGKDFERTQYKWLIRRLGKDDLIYIKSIERLGRNYEEINEQWRVITKVKSADIVVLDMPLLDTRRGKDLLGMFLADIVLQVLSFVAENEWENIRSRQAEGIAAVKERGVKFGRPPKPLPENFSDVYQWWEEGKLTNAEAARACGLPTATFRYKANVYRENAFLTVELRSAGHEMTATVKKRQKSIHFYQR